MRCQATTLAGTRCKNTCKGKKCSVHSKKKKSPTKMRFSEERESEEKLSRELTLLTTKLINLFYEEHQEAAKITMEALKNSYPEIRNDILRGRRDQVSVIDIVERRKNSFRKEYKDLIEELEELEEKYEEEREKIEKQIGKINKKLDEFAGMRDIEAESERQMKHYYEKFEIDLSDLL